MSELSTSVLFGGQDESLDWKNDTWLWDGSDWTELECASSPDPRCGFGFAYDNQRHVIVVFGGNGDGGVRLNDTWEFDGETWREVATEHIPGVRDQNSVPPT